MIFHLLEDHGENTEKVVGHNEDTKQMKEWKKEKSESKTEWKNCFERIRQ